MRKLAILLGLSLPFAGSAQLAHLPASTNNLMVFDLVKLGKKIDLKTIGNYRIIKPSDSVSYSYSRELLKFMLSNLSGNGIDVKGQIISFNDQNDSFYADGYLLPVADMKKAGKALESWSSRITFTDNRPTKYSSKQGNYYISSRNQYACGIFKSMLVIYNGPYAYYGEYEESYEKRQAEDSVKAIIDSIRWSRPVPPKEEPGPDIDRDVQDGEEPVADVGVDDYYDYDSDSLMIAFRSWWKKQAEIKEKNYWAKQDKRYQDYADRLWNNRDKQGSLLVSRPEIKTENAAGSDVFHWIDFSGQLEEMAKDASSYRSYDDSLGYSTRKYSDITYEKSAIGKFFGKIHFYGNGVFDQGSMTMTYAMSGSDSLKPFVQRAIGKGVKQELFDIFKTGEVSFLMAQHSDFSVVTDFYMRLFDKMYETRLQAVPPNVVTREEPYAWLLAFGNMYYNMLDKNMVEHTFSGDMVAAVTGITNFKRTYYSYDYDDEGEYKRVKKTDNTDIPAIVAALGLESTENFNKLIGPWIKYGILNQVNRNVYRLRQIEDMSLPGIYFVIHKNMLVVTNDSIYSNPDYLSRPGALSAELIAAASSGGSYMRTDGQATGKLLGGISGMSPAALVQTGKLTESIRQMEATGSGSDGVFSLKTRVDFVNQSRSSLLELMELTDVLMK